MFSLLHYTKLNIWVGGGSTQKEEPARRSDLVPQSFSLSLVLEPKKVPRKDLEKGTHVLRAS